MLPKSQSGLAVVGRFSYLHEADIARALLESEGIESWLLDENQIRHRWHLGGALGGVKLAVAPEVEERARELLGEDASAALDWIPEQDLPPHADEVCERCGSASVTETVVQRAPGPFQWLASFLFLFVGALVPRRRFQVDRACRACGHEWSVVERR